MVKLELVVPGPSDRETRIQIQARCMYGEASSFTKPLTIGDDGNRYHIHTGICIVELFHQKSSVITHSAAKQSIKHPIDNHEPVKTLKRVLGELMTDLELDKLHRTLLWNQIMNQFDFNQFGVLYVNMVLEVEGFFAAVNVNTN